MADVLSMNRLVAGAACGSSANRDAISSSSSSSSSVGFLQISASPASSSSTTLDYESLKSSSSSSSSSSSCFHGRDLVVGDERGTSISQLQALSLQMSPTPTIWKAMRWWEKGLHPNMKEICSAGDLVDSLLNAGNKLVVVDFFSPGCGGCRSIHPKICQFAEMNPEVMFLQVNYEEHKSMCYSLNIRVLPFFRFYRGAQGRLSSFSCTNATNKKFKDALAKHSTDRCSLGHAKGLEESELLALTSNNDLSFTYTRKTETVPAPGELVAEEKAFVVTS